MQLPTAMRSLSIAAVLLSFASAACAVSSEPAGAANEKGKYPPDASLPPPGFHGFLAVAHASDPAVVLYHLDRFGTASYADHIDACYGARAVAATSSFDLVHVLCPGSLLELDYDTGTYRQVASGGGASNDVDAHSWWVAVADLRPGQVTVVDGRSSPRHIAVPGAAEVTAVAVARVRGLPTVVASTAAGELWWIDIVRAVPPAHIGSLGEAVGGLEISELTTGQPSVLVTGADSGSLYDIQLWPTACPGSCFIPPPQSLGGAPADVVQAQNATWNTGSVDVWVGFPGDDEIRETPLGGGATVAAPGAAGMAVRHWGPNESTVFVAAPDVDEVRAVRVGANSGTWSLHWGPDTRAIDVAIASSDYVVPDPDPPRFGVPVPNETITKRVRLRNPLPEGIRITSAAIPNDDKAAVALASDDCSGAELGQGMGCDVDIECTVPDGEMAVVAPLDIELEVDGVDVSQTIWVECWVE